MIKLPEHEEVYFRSYEELSYKDCGSKYIDLYERDNFLGAAFCKYRGKWKRIYLSKLANTMVRHNYKKEII